MKKEDIFRKIISLGKVEHGQMLPLWGIVLRIFLFPIDSFKAYFTDSYIIDGISFSRAVIEQFSKPTRPSTWFRVDLDESNKLIIRHVTLEWFKKAIKLESL